MAQVWGRRRLVGIVLGMLALLAAGGGRAVAEPIRVYAAGSLTAPLKALIAAAGLPPGSVAEPTFGPSGTLRERLEGGQGADLFFSADLGQPRRLVESGRGRLVVPFVRNQLCVLARAPLGLTPETLLDRLLAPSLRLVTSTPVADPGGDYAFAAFDRADTVRPGAGDILRGKAMLLLVGPNAVAAMPGHSPAGTIFLADRADAILGYCSSAQATMREVPGLAATALPETLSVPAVYGLTLLSERPEAMRLALFALSEEGQGIFARYGLVPLAAPSPKAP